MSTAVNASTNSLANLFPPGSKMDVALLKQAVNAAVAQILNNTAAAYADSIRQQEDEMDQLQQLKASLANLPRLQDRSDGTLRASLGASVTSGGQETGAGHDLYASITAQGLTLPVDHRSFVTIYTFQGNTVSDQTFDHTLSDEAIDKLPIVSVNGAIETHRLNLPLGGHMDYAVDTSTTQLTAKADDLDLLTHSIDHAVDQLKDGIALQQLRQQAYYEKVVGRLEAGRLSTADVARQQRFYRANEQDAATTDQAEALKQARRQELLQHPDARNPSDEQQH